MTISSGGVAENTVLHSGGLMIFAGGIARNTEFVSGAKATLNNGVLETVYVNSNAFLTTSETLISGLAVRERGAAYVSGGMVSGGSVENLGIMQLCSGTIASDLTVKSGGHCYIGSGAEVSGTLTISAGATVLAFTGSTFNFSIDSLAAGNAALINDFSLIKGNLAYTITAGAGQAAGTYRLADKVDSFAHDVRLEWDGEVFEGFNVGETVTGSDGTVIALDLQDGSLLLEVSPAVPLIEDEYLLAGIEAFAAAPETSAAGDMLSEFDGDSFKNGLLA